MGAKNGSGSENFWRVEADDLVFWDAYVTTRPNYSASFYDEIYTHHKAHSASWEVAHDIGCGAGQVADEFSKHFQRVVASDLNDTHLVVAERRMALNKAVTYCHSKGETLHELHEHGTVDMVGAAEAMVLMDSYKALNSFHKLLRPNSTLAFWFYGRPTFSDDMLFRTAQDFINTIMDKNWSKVIQKSDEDRLWGFKRAAEGMASWLDYVEFDQKKWKDIRRIKWNTHATLPFFGEVACGFPINKVSNVKDNEMCEERIDKSWWQNEWDAVDLKRYFAVLFPGFDDPTGEKDAEIRELFLKLEKAMGGPNVKHGFTWPSVLVLATKQE